MAGRKNNSIGAASPFLIFIAIGAIAMLLFADNLESAYAYTLTEVSNSGVDVEGILRVGDDLFLGTGTGNAVFRFDAETLTAVDSVVCTACAGLATYNGRIYSFGTSILYEIDITTNDVMVVTRQLAISGSNQCQEDQLEDNIDVDNGQIVCAGSSSSQYKIYDLDSMTLVFTSGTLTGGGCTQAEDAYWNYQEGWIMLNCVGGTDQLSVYTEHTTTLLHSRVGALPVGNFMSYDRTTDNLIFADGSGATTLALYDYDTDTGFAVITASLTDIGTYDSGSYLSAKGFVLVMAGTKLGAYDITDGALLWQVTTTSALGPAQVTGYDAQYSYVAMGASTDKFIEFDMTGLSVGQSGSGGGTVGAFECVTIQVNNSTSFEVCDDDGDGILDWQWSDLPSVGTDAAEAIPGFLQIFGLNEDAANLVAAILIHILVIFGTAGMFFFKTHVSPPFFIWVALLIFGGGLSAAIGVMPLLYFFVEIALTVGAVAALVKTGVIGS